MLRSGLVSVTFRQHSVDEIIAEAKKCNLSLIEWGGDIHVPSGDFDNALEVSKKTKNAGLETAAYGSYFKLGINETDEIDSIIATAKALGTNVIRIWGGNKNSFELTASEYSELVNKSKEVCDKATKQGITLALECHNNTITDDYKAAIKFLADVNCESLKMYWQPNQFKTDAYNLEAAKALMPFTVNVHVFYWEGNNKLPFKNGEYIWQKYIEIFINTDCGFLLEFMHDGKIETLSEEAMLLNKMLK